MNSEHAQIHAVFELMSNDIKLTAFIDFDGDHPWKFLWMAVFESSTMANLGGEFSEFNDDNDFWDWKDEQEKYGNVVFWIKDGAYIVALSVSKKLATSVYGLWKMSKFEGIKSSWK
jgi:hypothetical protein